MDDTLEFAQVSVFRLQSFGRVGAVAATGSKKHFGIKYVQNDSRLAQDTHVDGLGDFMNFEEEQSVRKP